MQHIRRKNAPDEPRTASVRDNTAINPPPISFIKYYAVTFTILTTYFVVSQTLAKNRTQFTRNRNIAGALTPPGCWRRCHHQKNVEISYAAVTSADNVQHQPCETEPMLAPTDVKPRLKNIPSTLRTSHRTASRLIFLNFGALL